MSWTGDMKSSHGNITHILEICSTKDHFFRMPYKDSDKAKVAALGFLKAMRDSPPDAVAALWSTGTMCTFEGVSEVRVPIFSIRASEIGSVALRPVYEYMSEEEEGEEWKS